MTARTGRSRRTDEKRDERRRTFLEAARRVIHRDGSGATMEAIAREAGVTKPILYRLFGDRDGLVEALGQEFGIELARRLSEALAGALAARERLAAAGRATTVDGAGETDPAPVSRAPEPRDVMRASIDTFLTMIEREPALYRFLTDRLAAPGARIADLTDVLARDIAVTVGTVLRDAGADSGAAEPWAYGLVGMVHAAGDWWVERRTIPRAQLVEYLVELCWDGMGTSLNPR